MAHLDETLEARRDELVTRWRERVSGTALAQTVSIPEIIDSLPIFIDQLIDALRRARSDAPDSPVLDHSEVAADHGAQRFRAGFSIQSVVREYGILRECIFDLLAEGETSVSIQEVRLMSHALTIGVTDAVSRFSQERDEQLERQAGDHLAFLAHELRNPITSGRFALDLLRKRWPPGDTRELDVLHRSLSRVQELIDRSLIQIRLRRMEVRLERTQLSDLVRQIASESEIDAEIKGCTIRLNLDDSVEIDCDPRLIGSAVSNLIRNAIKFTRSAGVIQIRLRAAEGVTTIEVEDECGGLPPGKVEELFTPFMQIGHDRRGFGLGLAIAKHAVEQHAGAIQVHNLDGKGCVFMLSLPHRHSVQSREE
ncbi:MAG TPA: HAMP domain-containing sensor histidine kinase [Haliangium sp.]|nr:HAMP domain-containing sensor histidine kinase [Haliangium sp.]